jgi:hypothetical protein
MMVQKLCDSMDNFNKVTTAVHLKAKNLLRMEGYE